jgi:FkbM family methyltransferase
MKDRLKSLVPTALLHLYQSRGLVRKAGRTIVLAEPEVLLLPFLCAGGRPAIDVGAHNGGYAVRLLKVCREVHVFEPQPVQASRLAAAFLFNRRARLHKVALSDRSGTTRMRVPLAAGQPGTGLATIEPENTLDAAPTEVVNVAMGRLDDFAIAHPGFIKIDVEGHEAAVVRGALGSITKYKPNLLIEAEERHHPGAVVALLDLLAPLGYQGFFLQNQAIQPIESFDVAMHQRPSDISGGHKQGGVYVNNFMFVQDADGLRRAVRHLLADRR